VAIEWPHHLRTRGGGAGGSGVRSQETGVRSQETGVRGQETEAGSLPPASCLLPPASPALVEVMRNTDLSGGIHAHPLVLLRTHPEVEGFAMGSEIRGQEKD